MSKSPLLETRLEDSHRGLQTDPGNPVLLEERSRLLRLDGQLLEGILACQRPELAKVLESHIDLARIYVESGMIDDALRLAQQALEQNPREVGAHLVLHQLLASPSLDSKVRHDCEMSIAGMRLDSESLRAYIQRLDGELALLDAQVLDLAKGFEESALDASVEFSLDRARHRRDCCERDLKQLQAWEASFGVLQTEQQAPHEKTELHLEEAQQRVHEERQQRYRALSEPLDSALRPLLNIRGVSAVVLMTHDGWIARQLGAQEQDLQVYSMCCLSIVNCLEEMGRDNWNTWVGEYANGMLMLARVGDDCYLLVRAQASSTLGALTLAVDKQRAQLQTILTEALSS